MGDTLRNNTTKWSLSRYEAPQVSSYLPAASRSRTRPRNLPVHLQDTESLLILFTSPLPPPQPAAASLLLQQRHITEALNEPAEAPPLQCDVGQLKSCRLPAVWSAARQPGVLAEKFKT
ncbi:hypothetical protein PAMP_013580 [Pampus punctatissimus]